MIELVFFLVCVIFGGFWGFLAWVVLAVGFHFAKTSLLVEAAKLEVSKESARILIERDERERDERDEREREQLSRRVELGKQERIERERVAELAEQERLEKLASEEEKLASEEAARKERVRSERAEWWRQQLDELQSLADKYCDLLCQPLEPAAWSEAAEGLRVLRKVLVQYRAALANFSKYCPDDGDEHAPFLRLIKAHENYLRLTEEVEDAIEGRISEMEKIAFLEARLDEQD